MKKTLSIITGIGFIGLFASFALPKSCIIQNPQPKDCIVIDVKVNKITKGSTKDIVFHDDGTDFYYINRGLEQGLNLDSLKTIVLNKTVTLHLAKVLGGVTSEHISQMALGNDIIYTEFMGEKKRKEASKSEFIFGKQNYKWFFIGLAFITIGFILMAGGGSDDPNVWNPDVFSWRRIRLAPTLVLIGFGIQVYAILSKPNKEKNPKS